MRFKRLKTSSGRGWKWQEPIYRVELVLYHGPYPAFVKLAKGLGLKGISLADTAAAGKAIEHWHDDGKRSYLIWIEPDFDLTNPEGLNTLVHEVMHVTMTALMRRGVNADATHEEPYCYFAGWLFEQCYRRLKGR